MIGKEGAIQSISYHSSQKGDTDNNKTDRPTPHFRAQHILSRPQQVCSISVSFCKFSMIAFSDIFVFCVIPVCVGWYGCFGRVTLLGDSTLSRLTVGVLIDCELGWVVCFSTCWGLDRVCCARKCGVGRSVLLLSVNWLSSMSNMFATLWRQTYFGSMWYL
jgi:hypothetical protein